MMRPWYRSWDFWQCAIMVATFCAAAAAGLSLLETFVVAMLAFGAGRERARVEGRVR